MTNIASMPPAHRHRQRYLREDILTTFCWLIVAVPVAMYFATFSFSALSSLHALAEGVGILAGLIGTPMILIMLLLAARVPIIERTFGQDKIIALHGRLGKPAFYFIVAHVLLLTLAYSLNERVNIFTETGRLFLTSGDMIQAYIALVLLIALVVSSLVLVRKKIPYEAWHVVHLISYAMVLFALPHQLSMSGIFIENSWQRLYWNVLYYGVLVVLVIFRALLPIYRSARFRLKIHSITPIADGVFSMEFAGRNLQQLKVAGGQFMVFRFLTWQTVLQAHPFSISRVPNSDNFRITVKVQGAGTRRLAQLPLGTSVFIEGPYGVFTNEARSHRDSLYIGAGIGVTPILAMLENSAATPHGAKQAVVFRTPNEGSIYHLDEFAKLAKTRNIKLYKSEGSRHPQRSSWLSASHAAKGVSISNYLSNPLTTDIFICGEQSWMNLVMDDALHAGVPRSNIHLERFTL